MTRYDIYFTGQIADGANLEKVKPQLGKMLRVNDVQLKRLFSGKAVRIKAGVEESTAVKYRNALRKIGAILVIRKSNAEQEQATQAAEKRSVAPKAPDAVENAKRATFGEVAQAPVATSKAVFGEVTETTPPIADRATFGEASEGEGLSASRASFSEDAASQEEEKIVYEGDLTAEANFDSIEELPDNRANSIRAPEGQLNFDILPANTGSLEEFAEEEIPVDLSGIDDSLLSPEGTDLDQSEPQPRVEISTGDLSAAPANTGSLEDCAEDEGDISLPDISKLEFAD